MNILNHPSFTFSNRSLAVANFFVVTLISIATFFLFLNIHYFSVPLPDFFGYLGEGRLFLEGKRPQITQFPPAYSILISFLDTTIPINYSGHIVGVILNILLFIVGTYVLWTILRDLIGKLALFVIALVIFNHTTYYVLLQSNNIAFFNYLGIVTYWAWLRNRKILAYFLAVACFFFRFEGVLWLVILGATDLVLTKNKTRLFKILFLLSAPVIIWLGVIHFLNPGGNPYLFELVAKRSNIPNWKFLSFHIPETLLDTQHRLGSLTTLLFYSYIALGITVFAKYRPALLPPALFLILYLLSHAFFPGTEKRYGFPIAWIIYLFGLWPMILSLKLRSKIARVYTQTLVLSLPLYIIIQNTVSIPWRLEKDKYYRADLRVAGEWLTNTDLPENTWVITLETHIIPYYTHNNNVDFVNIPQDCSSIMCILASIPDPLHKNIILIANEFVSSEENYALLGTSEKPFVYFRNSPAYPYFTLLKYEFTGNDWLEIYKLNQNYFISPA